jgi:choline dehydrogenase-like flavoprotein
MDLAERWLQVHGVEAAKSHAVADIARTRARRYPKPVNWVWPLVVAAMDWLAPLFTLGRMRRARALTAEQFDQLEQKIQHHAWAWPRMIWQLVRLPLWDALYGGPSPTPPLPQPSGATPPRDFDVIVIGSGAGGAPVATVLAERGLRVAILEAGGKMEPLPPPQAIERYFLQQGMTLSLEGGAMPVFAGQGLGGTTAINSGTSLPPPLEWLARWDALTGGSFTAELPAYVAAASARIGVTVPPRSLLGASAAIIDRGLHALGRTDAYVLPRNAPRCVGAGVCCFVCPSGAKQSTEQSFLPQAEAHGAVVLAHTRATSIVETAGAVTVTTDGPDGVQVFRARHVVLAAGALLTPGLIRRNRLGQQWRDAGNHLKIHPASKVFARFAETIGGAVGVPQGLGYQPPELPRVVLEGIFMPPSAVAPMVAAAGKRADAWLDNLEHVATFGLMVRDRGHGSVREIAGRPILRYRLHAEDMRDMARGLILIAEAFFAAGAKEVMLPFAGTTHEVSSVEALRQLRLEEFTPSRLVASGFHPQGTAGIGRVVDRDLRLTARTSVCDASVLPDSPGVNPQLTIMGLSLRLADRLTAELQMP